MLRPSDTTAGPPEGLLAYRAEEDLLRVETHHRLMNTFMILSALLQREYNAPEPYDRSALSRSIQVVRAHADLHRLLANTSRDHAIDAADYLTSLCKALSEAVLAPRGVRCEAAAETGLLSGAQGEWLGLVICELVLNAAKHAFNDTTPGLVRVALTRASTGWRCAVADNGRGAVSGGPPGLGFHIVNALVARLNGTITAGSGACGHAVAVEFPMIMPDFNTEA